MDEHDVPDGYAVELLTPDRVERLEALLAVFGAAFEDRETYQGAVPSRDYLAKFLARDDVVVVTAVHGAEIVGGLVAYMLVKFEQERREIYIYDLAVDAGHRRKGLATAVIGELGRVAAANGAHVMYVQADVEDAPAIALYEKLGTREDVYHFDIAVKR